MLCFSILGLLACKAAEDDTDTDDGEIVDLGDPLEGLAGLSACESYTDSEGDVFFGPGRTEFIVVDLDFDETGTEASGYLDYILFANQTWKDLGGDDCVVRWRLTGSVVDATSCGACDLGLALNASVLSADSTCPEAFYAGLEQWTAAYEVLILDENEAAYYYTRSGAEFATDARYSEERTWARSDAQCKWFYAP